MNLYPRETILVVKLRVASPDTSNAMTQTRIHCNHLQKAQYIMMCTQKYTNYNYWSPRVVHVLIDLHVSWAIGLFFLGVTTGRILLLSCSILLHLIAFFLLVLGWLLLGFGLWFVDNWVTCGLQWLQSTTKLWMTQATV